jgi:uncharacterized protein (TIGR03643 family)
MKDQSKICPVCHRSFHWRKKWAKNWDEVKYCSDRCRGVRTHSALTADDYERIQRMAWEDRTPFLAIEAQFGLTEEQVKAFMKSIIPLKRYEAWRERVKKSPTLKDSQERGFKVGRFKSARQRLNGTLKDA